MTGYFVYSLICFALCVSHCYSQDLCSSQPCLNGGSCKGSEGDRGFECRCQRGFSGDFCEKDINECTSNPCQNGGNCTDSLNEYVCQCLPGFTGQNCEESINHCISSPCGIGTCVNLVNDFYCECPSGYIEVNKTCHSTFCESSICENGGTCVGSVCKCTGGYVDKFCKTPKCDLQPCQNGGTCANSLHNYSCTCKAGFTGAHCENDINNCASQPCRHGKCINLPDRYECKCEEGYIGVNCDIDSCIPNPCKNSALCLPDDSQYPPYRCVCLSGYSGKLCQTPFDRCSTRPCKNNGNCTGNSTSYQCHCKKGYEGDQCEKKIDPCNPNPCQNNGMCVNVAGGIKCVCSDGFIGTYCQIDVDECSTNPCHNHAECVDGFGTFACKCHPGFTGKLCDQNEDSCALNPCLNRGICFDQINGYTCKCPSVYTGEKCQNIIDICHLRPCMHGGTCTQKADNFMCSCPVGFHGSRCECKDTDTTCTQNTCHVLGTQKYNKSGNNFTCVCNTGWTGQYCDKTLSCEDNPCWNGGTCNSSEFGAVCICPWGYTGEFCQTQESRCHPNPCDNNGTCVEKHSGYRCLCPGWATGENCKTFVYLSCKDSPCLNGGACTEKNGSYFCSCPKYWTGYKCQDYLPLVSKFCKRNNCVEKGKNGVCDQECNFEDCLFDNTECSFGLKPWENCTQKTTDGKLCSEVFQNGVCNRECANEICLFDGFDCEQPIQECKYNSYCDDFYANNICDHGCNNMECGWDGSDCDKDKLNLVEGLISIIILKTPEEFIIDKNQFLRKISHIVHATVLIKKGNSGEEMIYRWTNEPNSSLSLFGDKKKDDMITTLRSRRAAIVGTKVYLEIDNHGCRSGPDHCFNNSDSAALFIAESIRTTYPDPMFPVHQIGVVKMTKAPEDLSNKKLILIVMLVVFLASLVVVVMVMLLLRQKRARGITWFPENFKKSLAEVPAESDKNVKDNKTNQLNMKRIYVCKDHTTPPPSNEGSQEDEEDESPKPKRLKVNRVMSVDTDQQWKLEHLYIPVTPLTPIHGLDIIPFDVNLKGPDGYTPLMLAAVRGSGLGEEEENNCGSLSSDGDNSTNVDIVTHLISQGAAINAQTDRTYETALHLAARYSKVDVAKVLLDAGADPNVADCTDRTALHCAVAADAVGVVQMLLRNRATNLNARMHCGTTALMLACRLSIENTVEDLIASNADLETVDTNGKTALHWAASVNNVSAVMLLLKNHANRDAQTAKEETPLFLASKDGAYESVKVLLDYYANRDLADHMDQLPRDVAMERHHLDIVDLLDNYQITSPINLDGRINSNIQSGPSNKHQARQTKSKSRKKTSSTKDPLIKSDSSHSIFARNSKNKKKKTEGETGSMFQQQQKMLQVSSVPDSSCHLQLVTSPDNSTATTSPVNVCPSLFTTDLSAPVDYQGAPCQPADFTNVDLLFSWNQSRNKSDVAGGGHFQTNGGLNPANSLPSLQAAPVFTMKAPVANYYEGYITMDCKSQLPFPPDVVLQQADQQDLLSQVPLPVELYNNLPVTTLNGSLTGTPHQLCITPFQLDHLLTPSPDSSGHWSSPRSAHSDISEGLSSPYEAMIQVNYLNTCVSEQSYC
ncbi:Neurogenic locus notch protein 2 [Bulinus truncatus]|nr:Neurogenic locus notch protein 2 [Bulinus truncatus]